MGIKSYSLQMIPWYCFHMGGHISCVRQPYDDHAGETSGEVGSKTVKLIMADGTVKVYHRPVIAGELMMEFPKLLVCHADSFFIGKKVPPLAETDRLQLGNKYFLLPRHFFQTALTFVTIASFAAADDDNDKDNNDDVSSLKKKEVVNKLLATCKAFDIQKSPAGRMQIRVSDEFISKLMEEGRLKEEGDNGSSNKEEKVCTTPQLQKDYSRLVECRRSVQWRPKLETIREKDRKKIGRFGIKRKKIKSQKGNETDKEKKTEKKQRKKERQRKKDGLKEVNEEPGRKAPPPPPPPPPAPSFRSFSSKIKWKKRL